MTNAANNAAAYRESAGHAKRKKESEEEREIVSLNVSVQL
jgi:hypothetical protein